LIGGKGDKTVYALVYPISNPCRYFNRAHTTRSKPKATTVMLCIGNACSYLLFKRFS